jgi:hypothetical protein
MISSKSCFYSATSTILWGFRVFIYLVVLSKPLIAFQGSSKNPCFSSFSGNSRNGWKKGQQCLEHNSSLESYLRGLLRIWSFLHKSWGKQRRKPSCMSVCCGAINTKFHFLSSSAWSDYHGILACFL